MKIFKKFAVLLCCMGVLGGCSGKTPPNAAKQEVLSYMHKKYGEEFTIAEIKYNRRRTHDTVIPIPKFLGQQTEDIDAVLIAENDTPEWYEEDPKEVRVYYDAEAKEFSDDYQYEKITQNLIQYVYERELDKIEQVSAYRTSGLSIQPNMRTREEIYEPGGNEQEYALQYVKDQDTAIYGSEAGAYVTVVCGADETEEVIASLDYIFQDLFKDSTIDIRFYDRADEPFQDSDTYMVLKYSEGEKSVQNMKRDNEAVGFLSNDADSKTPRAVSGLSDSIFQELYRGKYQFSVTASPPY